MSKEFTGARFGYARPAAPKRRSIASVELITTAALALSTAVAITAVSIGIARADVAGSVGHGDGAPFAIAVFIGLLLSGMGGLTALMASDQSNGIDRG
jgi:hypothetical protein